MRQAFNAYNLLIYCGCISYFGGEISLYLFLLMIIL